MRAHNRDGAVVARLRRLRRRVLGDPPDGFGVIVALTVLFVLGIGVVAPVLPAFVRELGLTNTQAALLLSSFSVGRVVWTIPGGPVVDRFGFRPITIASSAVLFAAMGTAALSRSLPVLLGAQALAGAASAQYTTAAIANLVARTPAEAMGRLLGAFQGLLVLVISFAPTVGGLAAAVFGISGPFLVACTGGLLALVLASTRLGTIARDERPSTPETDSRQKDRRALRRLITGRTFLLAIMTGLASTWSVAAIRNTLVPLFADQHLGMSQSHIGLLLTFGGLAGLAGMLPSGHAMDLLGRRPVVRWGMAATGITATAFVLVDSVWMIFAILGAMGLSRGIVSPTPAVIVADIADPNTRGSAVAVSRMGPALGLAIGPFAAGVLSDTVGIQAAFLVSGIFLSSLALAAVAIPETLVDRGDAQ